MITIASDDNIRKAALIIRKGGLVVFPTETVYGLGASALNQAAAHKIFEVKQRPANNPLIVHIDSPRQLRLVTLVPKEMEEAAWFKALLGLWPGPLTLVMHRSSSLPSGVTGGLDSVAVRMPSHPVAKKLITAAAVPIAAPSANVSSRVSATTAAQVEETLGSSVDMILDGGPCNIGVESTILSLVESPPRLLRPGAVPVETLSEVLGLSVEELTRVPKIVYAASNPLAPGMLKEHYAPKTRLVFRKDAPASTDDMRVGLLSFGPSYGADDKRVYSFVTMLSENGDLEEVAHRLFSGIYEMDKLGLDLMVVDECQEEGLGRAIMDRLRRATAKFIGS